MKRPDISKPDFVIQAMTGALGACFRLDESRAIALLTGPEIYSGPNPERDWSVFLLDDKHRDATLEAAAMAQKSVRSLIDVERVQLRSGREGVVEDKLIKFREKNFGRLLAALRKFVKSVPTGARK
jgi:hypothetical protein